MKTEFISKPDHLFVKISGKWTTENAFQFIRHIKDEADDQNVKLILVDSRELSVPENEMIRFYTGEKVAEVFKHRYKIATISHPQKVNQYAETVAVNRMARMKVFYTEKDALSWLLED